MKPPEGASEKLCKAKLEAYCLEWYSKGFIEENRPKGYDFSDCEKYGITEPNEDTCRRVVG